MDESHPFNKTIADIYARHKNQNISTRCLGIDPHIFAWAVIQAWQERDVPDFDDDEWSPAPGTNERIVKARFIHKGKGKPYLPDFDQ